MGSKSQILAADIGATNSRFARFSAAGKNNLKLENSEWFSTRDVKSLSELLTQVEKSSLGLTPSAADVVSIAIAGPVERGVYCKPPYITWPIDFSRAEADYGIKRFSLINDFVAQAYACASPIRESATLIKPGESDQSATIAVIGAGSNLGKSILIPLVKKGLESREQYLAVPSEGGHISFPVENERELQFAEFVRKELGDPYLTCNSVVSGKGLSFIHHFLTGVKLEPSEVAKTFTDQSETLQWASRFYARVCRNFCLDTLSLGGVYIAGGVAAKLPRLVTHPVFSDEFIRSPRHEQLLKKVPISLLTNEESGLWGAAFCGSQQLDGTAGGE